MNDRTGQIWHVGTTDMWQVFVVIGVGSVYNGGVYHPRLILSSNWKGWAGKVAPYPEDNGKEWEGVDHFKRIT